MSVQHTADCPAYLPKGASASCGCAQAAILRLCPSLCRCALMCFGTETSPLYLQRQVQLSIQPVPIHLRTCCATVASQLWRGLEGILTTARQNSTRYHRLAHRLPWGKPLNHA